MSLLDQRNLGQLLDKNEKVRMLEEGLGEVLALDYKKVMILCISGGGKNPRKGGTTEEKDTRKQSVVLVD